MVSWQWWDGTGRTRCFLRNGDNVLYLRTYTPRGGFKESETNQLIVNLKMGANKPKIRLPHRARAIRTFAEEMTPLFNQNPFTVSWIPSSKAKDDLEYDNRLEEVLHLVQRERPAIEVVEVFYASGTRPSFHHGSPRNPDVLKNSWQWVDGVDLRAVSQLVVIDDVLTCGTSFRAFSDKVKERYPNIGITGIIWAAAEEPDASRVFAEFIE